MISLAERVAAHFEQRKGQWIDARELVKIGGFGGWRTRVSELRHAPYHMRIENHVNRIVTARGQVTRSFYRYQP